jgi:hypothetical protein
MPRSNTIIDSEFFREFKKVRNLFRKFEPLSVVFQILKYINTQRTALAASHHPWILLLLIKWVFQDEQVFQRGRKEIDDAKLRKLIDLAYKVGDCGRSPAETEGLDIFFRRMAYQQFIYQNQIDGVLSSFALDINLFGSSANQAFSNKFYEKYSLSVEDFLVLAFAVAADLMSGEKRSFFEVSFFDQLSHEFDENVPLNFLDAISIRIGNIPDRFKKPPNYRISADEIYETSPFFSYPLIKVDNRYFVTHPEVVVRGLKDFLYRQYKTMMNDKQKRRFGILFQNEASEKIDYLGAEVKTEVTLKQEIGDQGKVVDFFIDDRDRPIFVEIKASELSKGGRLAISSMRLKDRMEQVLYAIAQAEDTLTRMKDVHFRNFDGLSPYLVVVTYGHFFIGDGTHLGALFENTSFEFPQNIPIENCFVVSFSEFEYLTKISKTARLSIGKILSSVKTVASQPEHREFIFQNYLDDLYSDVELPRALDDPFTRLLEKTLSEFNASKDQPV